MPTARKGKCKSNSERGAKREQLLGVGDTGKVMDMLITLMAVAFHSHYSYISINTFRKNESGSTESPLNWREKLPAYKTGFHPGPPPSNSFQ